MEHLLSLRGDVLELLLVCGFGLWGSRCRFSAPLILILVGHALELAMPATTSRVSTGAGTGLPLFLALAGLILGRLVAKAHGSALVPSSNRKSTPEPVPGLSALPLPFPTDVYPEDQGELSTTFFFVRTESLWHIVSLSLLMAVLRFQAPMVESEIRWIVSAAILGLVMFLAMRLSGTHRALHRGGVAILAVLAWVATAGIACAGPDFLMDVFTCGVIAGLLTTGFSGAGFTLYALRFTTGWLCVMAGHEIFTGPLLVLVTSYGLSHLFGPACWDRAARWGRFRDGGNAEADCERTP